MKLSKADIWASHRTLRNSCLTQQDRDDLAVLKAINRATRNKRIRDSGNLCDEGHAKTRRYRSEWKLRLCSRSLDRMYFHGELFDPERRAQFTNARHIAHLMQFARSGAKVLP